MKSFNWQVYGMGLFTKNEQVKGIVCFQTLTRVWDHTQTLVQISSKTSEIKHLITYGSCKRKTYWKYVLATNATHQDWFGKVIFNLTLNQIHLCIKLIQQNVRRSFISQMSFQTLMKLEQLIRHNCTATENKKLVPKFMSLHNPTVVTGNDYLHCKISSLVLMYLWFSQMNFSMWVSDVDMAD